MDKELHYCILPRKVARSRGLSTKYYMTHKSCANGHLRPRFISSFGCMECAIAREKSEHTKAYKKKHREENPEWYKIYHSRYYENNKERISRLVKDYREKNREKYLEWCRDYNKRTREHQKVIKKQWYLDNIEWCKKKASDYRKENPMLMRDFHAKRRSLIKSGITAKEMRDWAFCQVKRCFYCSVDCEQSFHVDHYVPLSKGGLHEIENLRISCATCNLRKSAKMPEEWLKEISREN